MNNLTEEKNINLDIIRCLAMSMVLLIHIGMQLPFPSNWDRSWLYVGGKGVQLFFGLSGYLVCKSALYTNNVKKFYIRRIVRIIPAYYIALIATWIYQIIMNWNGSPVNRWLHLQGVALPIGELLDWKSPYGISFIRYFFFLQMLIPSSDFWHLNNLNGLWTMSSFALFYFLIPLMIKVFKSFESMFVFTILMLLCTPYMKNLLYILLENAKVDELETFISCHPISNLYCFMLGVTLYYAFKANKTGLYSLILAIFMVFTNFKNIAFEGLFTILIGVMLTSPEIISNRNLKKFVRRISNISFSVYLLHTIVIDFIVKISVRYNFWGTWGMFVLMLGGSILFPAIVHVKIIEPMTKIIQKKVSG